MAWDGTISFAGTAFEISFAPVTRRPSGDVSIRHIPGTGVGAVAPVDYVDIGGRHGTFTVAMTMFFKTAAAFLSFEAAKYMVSGTLIYFDPVDGSKTSYTALLTKLERQTRNLSVEPSSSPPPNWGETHADAEFLVTAVNS